MSHNNSRHTPGPWTSSYGSYVYKGERFEPEQNQRLIAEARCPNSRAREDWNETFANARLIAAVPDMLDALQRALRFISALPTDRQLDAPMNDGDTGRAVYSAILAAITRATGEPS